MIENHCSRILNSVGLTKVYITVLAFQQEFDKKYNPTWHCIVGRNFGSYVTHETKHFIYFYLGQVAILLFKSGWEENCRLWKLDINSKPGLWRTYGLSHTQITHTHTRVLSFSFTYMNLAIEAVHKCMDRVYLICICCNTVTFFAFCSYTRWRNKMTFVCFFQVQICFALKLYKMLWPLPLKYIKNWYVIHILGKKWFLFI